MPHEQVTDNAEKYFSEILEPQFKGGEEHARTRPNLMVELWRSIGQENGKLQLEALPVVLSRTLRCDLRSTNVY
jgi:hypothetical protein